jgi:hypothetical protein
MLANKFEESTKRYTTEYIPDIYEAARHFVSSQPPKEDDGIRQRLRNIDDKMYRVFPVYKNEDKFDFLERKFQGKVFY